MKNSLNYQGITVELRKRVKYNYYEGKLLLSNNDIVTFECSKFSQINNTFLECVRDYLEQKKNYPSDPFLIHYIKD